MREERLEKRSHSPFTTLLEASLFHVILNESSNLLVANLERNQILPATPAPTVELGIKSNNAGLQSLKERSVLECTSASSNLGNTFAQKDQDDEETLASVKIKTEPREDSAVPTTSTLELLRKRRSSAGEVIELLDSDDEAPLPKKVKTEASQDTQSLQLLSMPSNTMADAATHAIVKIESQEDSCGLGLANRTHSDQKQTKKSKKKSRLMLELEEIRIRKELQALEDEEDD